MDWKERHPCNCKAAGTCPDVDPLGSGVSTFDPNQLKYSDYVAIELGFGITAEGVIVNDDQPYRPARPGERFSHCCDKLQNETGSVHPTLFYTTSSKSDMCLSQMTEPASPSLCVLDTSTLALPMFMITGNLTVSPICEDTFSLGAKTTWMEILQITQCTAPNPIN